MKIILEFRNALTKLILIFYPPEYVEVEFCNGIPSHLNASNKSDIC